MGSMPEVIAKGPILKKMDALSTDKAKATALLNDLKTSTADLTQVLINNNVLTNLEAIEHYRCDLKYWFPDAQPIEPIIRRGLTEAFSVSLFDPDTGAARPSPLPVDCYWVCDTGHDEEDAYSEEEQEGSVEISVSWSAVQVTAILFTPEPPYPGPEGNTKEPIFVIKRDKTTGKVIRVQPTNEP